MSPPFRASRGSRDGPTDDPLDLSRDSRPELARIDLDALQPEPLADLAQEVGPGPAGLGQDHPRLRPGNLQRDARQPRPRAHVDQRRGEVDEPQDQQAVDIVLQHHVLEVVDSRQVEAGVRLPEHPVVAPERVQLRSAQRRCRNPSGSLRSAVSSGSHERIHSRGVRLGSCPVRPPSSTRCRCTRIMRGEGLTS